MGFQNLTNGLQHLGLPTADMEKTLDFYQKLGFEIKLKTVNPATGDVVAFLQMGNLVIETYESRETAGKSGAIDHLALDTVDIEAAFASAKELELNIIEKEIQFLPFWENGVRFFNTVGPNGEKIEFCQKL